MNSQVLQAPTPEEVKDLLAESKRRNACPSLYTRCAVAYEGRAQSQLANQATGSFSASPTGQCWSTATRTKSRVTGSPRGR